jgi:hypothetical protein
MDGGGGGETSVFGYQKQIYLVVIYFYSSTDEPLQLWSEVRARQRRSSLRVLAGGTTPLVLDHTQGGVHLPAQSDMRTGAPLLLHQLSDLASILRRAVRHVARGEYSDGLSVVR